MAHLATVQLRGVSFKVSESAHQRVLAQRPRNVHAYAIGTFTSSPQPTATEPISYNPYQAGHFFRVEDQGPIHRATGVVLTQGQAYASARRPAGLGTGRIDQVRPHHHNTARSPRRNARIMKASEAPTLQSPTWNAYRCQVIGAITDVEVLMQQLDKGINSEVLAEEVAQRLGMDIDTPEAFEALLKLVKATRSIAREGLRMTSQQQGGQFTLPLR